VQGGYCLSGLSATPRNVQVTPQNGFNGAVIANSSLGVFGQCPVGTQVSIVLFSAVTGAAVSNGFFVAVD
jgi:hypothetical protein